MLDTHLQPPPAHGERTSPHVQHLHRPHLHRPKPARQHRPHLYRPTASPHTWYSMTRVFAAKENVDKAGRRGHQSVPGISPCRASVRAGRRGRLRSLRSRLRLRLRLRLRILGLLLGGGWRAPLLLLPLLLPLLLLLGGRLVAAACVLGAPLPLGLPLPRPPLALALVLLALLRAAPRLAVLVLAALVALRTGLGGDAWACGLAARAPSPGAWGARLGRRLARKARSRRGRGGCTARSRRGARRGQGGCKAGARRAQARRVRGPCQGSRVRAHPALAAPLLG